jgi:hypothetical protein
MSNKRSKGIFFIVIAMVLLVILGLRIVTTGRTPVISSISHYDPLRSASFKETTTLDYVLHLHGPYDCSFKVDIGEIQSSGSMYVYQGTYRYENTSITQGKFPIQSFMVSDGTFAYMWSSITNDGIKRTVEKQKQELINTNASPGGLAWFYSQNIPFVCNASSAHSVLESLPKNIHFIEY